MPESTENYDLIVTAQQAVEPYPIDARGLFLARNADGDAHVIDVSEKLYDLDIRPPANIQAARAVRDVESFVEYLAKHGLDRTELWASRNAGTIQAVIDAHESTGEAGHEKHTITLRLIQTDDAADWRGKDGEYLPQAAFAEFIEDHIPNFTKPSGAEMLELAQTFQATTKVDFESSSRVKSGETQLAYKEQTQATAGKKGSLTIPDTFTIAFQPYRGRGAWTVTARFRYRINGGDLRLAYRLERIEDVLDMAFAEVVDEVKEKTGRQVWLV